MLESPWPLGRRAATRRRGVHAAICVASVVIGFVQGCGESDDSSLRHGSNNPPPSGSTPVSDGGHTGPGVPDGGTEPPPPPAPSCDGNTCSNHGVCQPSTGACLCDDGFDAPDCANRNADYGKRYLVSKGLADPDVLKLDDDHYVLSGTGGGDASEFRFLESTDLLQWNQTTTYRPKDLDPNFGYCWMWAPAFAREGSKIVLYFSALQYPKAQGCQPLGGSNPRDVATFRAVADDDSLKFGVPEPLFAGTNGPRTYTPKGCPELCGNAIRIDSAVLDDRLYYVYFAGGNNVTSVRLSDASQQLFHTGPDIAGTRDSDEGIINEAPEPFKNNGRLYLFFSTADFRGPYTTRYMMGNSPSDLTRKNTTAYRLDSPAYSKAGKLAETHGHNSVTTRRGETFNFFHVGVFNNGNLVGRDVWRQRIVWKDDGTAHNQNAVTVSWNGLGGSYVYSLDLVLRDGSVVGPCVGSGILNSGTSYTYKGVCPDSGDRSIHKADIAKFRMYAAVNGNYKQAGEATYDGYSDRIDLPITAP